MDVCVQVGKENITIGLSMTKIIDIINTEYISSSQVTEQYKAAKRLFRSSMKKLFPTDEILIGSCPHFEFSGMIKREEHFVYFSTGDLRGNYGNSMLVRTAKHDKDWTGGSNNFVSYSGREFDEAFRNKVDQLFNNQKKAILAKVEYL